MSWTTFVSDSAQWVSAPIDCVFGIDEFLEGEDLYFSAFGCRPDSYTLYGEYNGSIEELKFSLEDSHLKYKGYIRGDAPVEVMIHHSSCVLGPNAWKGIRWEIWDYNGDTPWVETQVNHDKITLGFVKSGIDVFKESHGKDPNTLIVNYCDSDLLFKIKNIANRSGLSFIMDCDLLEDEDVLLIINLPYDGGGKTLDDEDDVGNNCIEFKKFRKAA